MEEWKTYKIGEICESISDTYKGKAPNVVLVNTSDVFDGVCLNHTNVPNKDLKGQFKKTFRRNDILYSEIRPANKRFAFIDFDPENYIASTKLMVIRCSELVRPRYLYHYLKRQEMLGELQALAESRSGTFPQITFSELALFEIKLPSLETQDRIASAIDCFDDKIAVNNRINHNLEQQALALYKYWFEEDIEYNNWPTTTLSAFFNVVTGKKDANFSTPDGQYAFFTCSQVPLRASSYSFDGKAILLAGNGDFNVKRYIGKFEAYQRTYVLMPFEGKYLSFLYLLMRVHLGDITGGSRGSVIKFITKGNISDYSFRFPTYCVDDKLSVLNAIYAQIDERVTEIEHLSLLRDQLIPKLIDGLFHSKHL